MALPGGVSASLFPRRVYGMAAPYHQSLVPSESVYAAVSSVGVKMQDGRKERIKEKTHRKQNKKK